MKNKFKKVAVVHDWLTGLRGGEKVLDSILKIYPDADLFTLIYNPGTLNHRIENRTIYTAFTNRLPFKSTKYRWFLPLFPTAIETFSFKGYDLIISSSHCVAKGIIPPPDSLHITYIHSPMRYVWDMYYDYFPKQKGIVFFLRQFISNYLRTWDVSSSARVDSFLCNSQYVGKRILKYYRRQSQVIYPPCLPEGFTFPKPQPKEDYYLIVSAFAPYKRIDLAIEAFRKNKKKLVIIGGGQEEGKIRKNLPKNITLIKNIPREEVIGFFQKARAFVFPGLEDFGIAPVEAQAYGTPVIAYGKGGALESIIEGKTGVFFYEQTPEALNQAIESFEKMKFQAQDLYKSASRFTEENFINQFQKVVDKLSREYL